MELRTIPLKFRVWDKDDKKFVKSVTISGPQCWPCRFNLVTGCFEMESDDRFLISQDTGLKDKNGKSIFMGDILKRFADDKLAVVEYQVEEEGSLFRGEVIARYVDGSDFYYLHWESDIEVIGAIWQNPELLEEKDV